jgi:FG-GAP-like repeat
VILAALFAVAVTAAPCESLQFDLPPAYDAGPSPAAAVAGDFDGDGNLDLLAGGLNGLTFLRGDGRGRFVSRRTLIDLPVTDLFAFGRTAIAYDARTGVATSLTYAAGDFRKVASITGSGPLSVGDFNGDHEADMLFSGLNVRAIGDVDGDGRDELVLLNGSSLTFMRQEGASFVTAGTLPISTPLPEEIVVADFDGDGRKDVGIRSNGIPLLDVYRSRGGFAFDPLVSSHYERGTFRVADVDGDRKPDLIADGGRFAVFLRGRGDGSFEAEQPLGRIFTGQVSGKPGVLAVADFDRDGLLDLASLAPNGVLFSRGNGDGSFGARRYLPVDDVLELADFNGDGRLDVLGSDGTSTYVSLRRIDGTYARVAAADPKDPIPSTNRRELVAAADINGDRKLDLVFANPGADGSITRWLGNGDGTFRRLPLTIALGTDPRSITLVDVNADGFLDVVIGNGTGTSFAFTYALGDPDGGYGNPHSLLPKADNGDPGFVADVNGDGFPDLVTAGAFGITMALDDDGGVFGPPIAFPFEQQVAAIIAVGDLDGDRKADLIYDDYHRLVIRYSLGDGTFGAVPLPLENLAESYTIGDVNGDGLTDVVATRESSTEVVLNRGALIFSAPQSWPVVDDWTVMDIDGDRLPDLVGDDGLVIRGICPVAQLPRRRTAPH